MANERAVKQLKRSRGFVTGTELIDKGGIFWTVTVWENLEAMKAFRNKGAHQLAMRKLPRWCDEASYTHWEQPDIQLPDWTTIHQKLINEGRVTKVRHPSRYQADKLYPPPVWQKSLRILSPLH